MERQIPKNVRQIGNVSDSPKIYVEDYVDTFFLQLCDKAKDGPIGAFLVGDMQKSEDEEYVYIYGAIQMHDLKLVGNEYVIDDETWKNAYEDCKQYFEDGEMLGWFVAQPGVELDAKSNIVKLHKKSFPKQNTVFVMKDSAEKEESYFVHKLNDLMEIGGRYTYYEKNPCMQNYMIAARRKNGVSPSETVEDRAAQDFRNMVRSRGSRTHQKKNNRLMYVASSILILVAVIMGVTTLNNFGKMKAVQKVMSGLVVGVLLLLISVFMIFQTTCKVWGAEKPANATQQGIDVSSHQGKIDWEQVKNSALADYAIIRCGYGVNQTDKDDKYWDYNSSECERLGIPYGTYLYSGADTTAKAKSEAEHVVRLLQGKNLTYPIYYDMEADMLNQLSSTQIGNIAKTFLNTMESYGYKNVAVYSNKYLFETKLTASVFSDYPKWIAQHSNKCTYRGSYHMWQYSTQGVIPGISEKVDLNYKIGNWTYAGYSSAKKTVVVKPKETTIKSLKKSGKKAVKITYKKVSGVSGYQIYMSTKKKSGYKKIATLSSKKSSYTKGKLKKGKKYYFKVRTMKKVSGKYRYSSFSKVRSIKR